jgi:ubiquinone/menaquinone biosynthesis C-methylase UbiE
LEKRYGSALPIQDFGRVADIYDATRSLPEDVMRIVIRDLSIEIPSGSPVADVGVGTGRFSKPLSEMGYVMTGVDISRAMLAKAREKGLDRLVTADVHRLPFRDSTFESSMLVHVLHLVSDWATVASEAARVSRGTVITVIESSEGVNLRHEYNEIRAEMGNPLVRFEGERGLEDEVTPDRVVLAYEGQHEETSDQVIQHLEERGQSQTWDVPEDMHRRIIDELRSKYRGTTFTSKDTLEVVVWKAPRLLLELRARHQKS